MRYIIFSAFVHLLVMVFVTSEAEVFQFFMNIEMWEIILLCLSIGTLGGGSKLAADQF